MANKVALNPTQADLHQDVLLNLLDVRLNLMSADPNTLTLDQHINWHDQLFKVGKAILMAEQADLTAISAGYAKALPGLKKGTDDLERDLHKLKAANDIIDAVSAALGTITSIITLLS